MMRVFLIACVIPSVLLLTCQEEMVYRRTYGYIYNIACTQLNRSNEQELKNIATNNKVRLILNYSNLTNLTDNVFKNIPNILELIVRNSVVTALNFVPKTVKLLSLLNNSMETLPNELAKIHQLRSLNLSYNSLSTFPPGILHGNMEDLDLSHNKYQNLDVDCNVTYINRLSLSHNNLKTLNKFPFTCLPLLNQFYLDYNSITQLPELKSLSYLTKLILNNNRLSVINNAFLGLDSLKELNLADNDIVQIQVNNFQGLFGLKTLNLRRNDIKTLALPRLNLIELNLERNKLGKVPDLTLKTLKQLYLSHNALHTLNFQNLEKLTHLYLSNCSVTALNANLQKLTNLEYLDLSLNTLNLNDDNFKHLENLLELDLSWNHLDYVPCLVFSSQINLEKLNLSHNALKKLDEAIFLNLVELRMLDLSHNSLKYVNQKSFEGLDNLRQLYVSHNQLSYLEYGVLVPTFLSLRVFDVSYNKFSCQFLTDMVTYLNTSQINFGDPESSLNFSENVSGIHCEDSVSVYRTAVIAIIVLMLLILVFIVSCIIYRHYFSLKKKQGTEELELIINGRKS